LTFRPAIYVAGQLMMFEAISPFFSSGRELSTAAALLPPELRPSYAPRAFRCRCFSFQAAEEGMCRAGGCFEAAMSVFAEFTLSAKAYARFDAAHRPFSPVHFQLSSTFRQTPSLPARLLYFSLLPSPTCPPALPG